MLFVFFFNVPATTEIYPLSLHAALPIYRLDFYDPATWQPIARLPIPGSGVDHLDFSADGSFLIVGCEFGGQIVKVDRITEVDRKSTRLNSSHANISYAVFCLKKKQNHQLTPFHSLALPFPPLLYSHQPPPLLSTSYHSHSHLLHSHPPHVCYLTTLPLSVPNP